MGHFCKLLGCPVTYKLATKSKGFDYYLTALVYICCPACAVTSSVYIYVWVSF